MIVNQIGIVEENEQQIRCKELYVCLTTDMVVMIRPGQVTAQVGSYLSLGVS